MTLNDLLTAFSLGSAAILTNACMLPLYPGLLAFMAGSAVASQRPSRLVIGSLGFLVLGGVLAAMLIIGLILYIFQRSFGAALPLILPIVYGVVIVFGVLLIIGRSPFARLQTAQSPVLRNRYLTAFLYGMLLGPMTLPCTGPIITSAFLIGASDSVQLGTSLLYFLFFGLGFGWPLLILPLLALPVQRQLTGWLAKHHMLLNRVSGVLLIAIGIFGIVTELLPQLLPTFEIEPQGWLVYWLIVSAIIALILVFGLRKPVRASI